MFRGNVAVGGGGGGGGGTWIGRASVPKVGLLLLLLSCVKVTPFKLQKFRVEPKDVNAREGSNVTLKCEIDDITGDVQWTKDGFALGYAAEIPGHPRHSMVIDSGNGVYNLLVRNVTITDDAQYQCQVSPGPAVANGSKGIRSSATLTVLTPPSSVEIINQFSDSKLEVRENHEITIDCVARNSRPASRILWFRGNSEINPERRSDNVSEETAERTKLKLYTVRSQINVTATSEDDRVKYTCEAHHEALTDPLTTTVQIRVLYPPGVPHIEGYTEGTILEKGQQVSLRCVSKVGNPPTQLSWFKNGQQIHNEYRTTEKVSESTYSFVANASDNNARYHCEAKNSISPVPQYADVVLSVSYGSSHVAVRGPDEAKQGDVVNLNCETGRSNPPSTIKWTVAGEPEKNSTSTVAAAPQSSWITRSNVSFVVPGGQHAVVVTCQAISNSPFERIVATHKINVLQPPGAPIISDYSSGDPISSGNVHRLSCVSTGGNPLASVAWFKNDKKIQSTITTNENSVSAELSLVVNYTDNDATFKCEVTHPALQVPLMKTQKLKVLFLPDHLNVKHEPVHLKPGVQATLTCEATSSNPAVKMLWFHQGARVTDGITSFTKPGLYGGKMSTVQLTVNVTADMDGSVYMCQGHSSQLQKSTHKEITLNVYHKPIFDPHLQQSFTATEGDAVSVTLPAKGRPSQITYKWFKNDEPLYSLRGQQARDSSMNITGVFRDDFGNYSCEASNSEGSTTFWFILSVKHKATITNTSVGVIVSEGDDAQLWCQIDGFPLGPEHMSWTRPNFIFDKRTSTLLKNNTSYLTILNVTKFDSGLFYCVANNGIGNESSHSVLLIVEHKPDILTIENKAKTASSAGMSAKLHCQAVGSPTVRFSWERDGLNITTVFEKYIVEQRQVNETFYDSSLTILQVDQFDYGDYKCIASNDLGRTTSVNRLTVCTHPDPPFNLRLVNSTHNKVTLSWSPGFDGGEPISYRIRYKVISSSTKNTYRYEDTNSLTEYEVVGLEPNTTYLFNIMARNMYGDSSYMPESLKVSTLSENSLLKSELSPEKSARVDRGISIVFLFMGAVAGVLILMSIIIVSYCIYRRRDVNKQMNDDNNDSSSKTPTIEMYAPNTYNEENVSTISAKSETYSNGSPDYNDEQQQKSAEHSYLIEQIDYPFITECASSQQNFQYGGGAMSVSSDHSIPRYVRESADTTFINMDNRAFHQPVAQPTCRAVPPPPPPMPLLLNVNRPLHAMPLTAKYGRYYVPSPPPPPDVTVFSSQNFLSTFAYQPEETEGHLV